MPLIAKFADGDIDLETIDATVYAQIDKVNLEEQAEVAANIVDELGDDEEAHTNFIAVIKKMAPIWYNNKGYKYQTEYTESFILNLITSYVDKHDGMRISQASNLERIRLSERSNTLFMELGINIWLSRNRSVNAKVFEAIFNQVKSDIFQTIYSHRKTIINNLESMMFMAGNDIASQYLYGQTTYAPFEGLAAQESERTPDAHSPSPSPFDDLRKDLPLNTINPSLSQDVTKPSHDQNDLDDMDLSSIDSIENLPAYASERTPDAHSPSPFVDFLSDLSRYKDIPLNTVNPSLSENVTKPTLGQDELDDWDLSSIEEDDVEDVAELISVGADNNVRRKILPAPGKKRVTFANELANDASNSFASADSSEEDSEDSSDLGEPSVSVLTAEFESQINSTFLQKKQDLTALVQLRFINTPVFAKVAKLTQLASELHQAHRVSVRELNEIMDFTKQLLNGEIKPLAYQGYAKGLQGSPSTPLKVLGLAMMAIATVFLCQFVAAAAAGAAVLTTVGLGGASAGLMGMGYSFFAAKPKGLAQAALETVEAYSNTVQ
jgi:hypothetical protein